MSSLEAKREEFRNYLEKCGVIDGLSKALIKLYEEQNKPDDAVRFIRKYMCEECPDDEQYEKLLADFQEANTHINTLERELSSVKGNIRRTPSETDLLLNEGMDALEADEECKSLLKKHLTRDIFDELKVLKTPYGSTLLDCIQSGLANHDSGCGIYAADADAYKVFEALFDPIIEEYHKGFTKENTQPDFDWGDPTTLGNLDPENEFIISTRVRCGRSIEGYGLNPVLKENQYMEIMEKLQDVLNNLEGDYKGHFYPLLGMEKDVQQQLIDDHFLFKEDDRFLESAHAYRFWPVGRGIFFNETKTFLVWCNEEDHLRLISMENTGDLANVYSRLVNGVNLISEYLQFSRNERLGWITFCPTNLGTTIRASVHIKLPKLAANMESFQEVAKKHNLQVRGTSGEHTESVDGVYDVSNVRRMGLTEYEAVKEMHEGIAELIKIEREL